jgi:hypothetical protein
LIVGSCCIKQFMDGTKLKCSRCTKTIQRRNKCSKALCSSCKNERQMKINELERKKELEYKQCMDCDNMVVSKYNRCFTCNSKEKKGKECMDCKKKRLEINLSDVLRVIVKHYLIKVRFPFRMFFQLFVFHIDIIFG